MVVKVNGTKIIGDKFAYDGCHKIYIIEDEQDLEDAKNYGYEIYDIGELLHCWNNSCSLRFISNWKLDKKYVEQCEENVDFDIKY